MPSGEVWVLERAGWGHEGLYESLADVLVDFPDEAWRPESDELVGTRHDNIVWSNWRDGEEHLECWAELVRRRLDLK